MRSEKVNFQFVITTISRIHQTIWYFGICNYMYSAHFGIIYHRVVFACVIVPINLDPLWNASEALMYATSHPRKTKSTEGGHTFHIQLYRVPLRHQQSHLHSVLTEYHPPSLLVLTSVTINSFSLFSLPTPFSFGTFLFPDLVVTSDSGSNGSSRSSSSSSLSTNSMSECSHVFGSWNGVLSGSWQSGE